jgi:hypothetical protein
MCRIDVAVIKGVDYKGPATSHAPEALHSMRSKSPAPARRPKGASRIGVGLLFLVLFAAYGAFLIRHAAIGVGGSDSSGYANTAKRLVAGTLVDRPRSLERLGLSDDLAPIFTPLGFGPGPRAGTMAPLYPIGFPVHLAAAAAVMGWERGVFWVSPIAAVICLLLIYLLARQLSLSRFAAVAAAAILGTWPTFVFQALQPMSDVVATLWCLAAILFALLARRRTAWAAAAGAAFGIAVFVRPTSALLLLPLAFALPIRIPALASFLAGGLPFAALFAAHNLRSYGGALATGWQRSGHHQAFAIFNVPPRFQHYGLWIVRTLTPLIPAGWLALAADRRTSLRDRALLLSWFAVFFAFYCFYQPYASFIFVRFLLPAVPALILGALLAARDLAMRLPRPVPVRIAGAIALAAILFAEVRSARNVGILQIVENEGSIYPEICRWSSRALPEGSLVIAGTASGALEYYTDLAYARRYDLSPESLSSLRASAERKGYRLFALLFPDEESDLSRLAPGRWSKIGELREVGLWRLDP